MPETATININSVTDRVRGFYQEKKAAEQGKMPSEEDPQKTEAPGVQKDDGDEAGKQQLPYTALSTQNSDGNGENNIPGGEKGEATGKAPNLPEGTDVTADKTQQKTDAAVDDPVTAKVAHKGLALASRISARLKQAATGEEVQDPEKKAEALAFDIEATPDLYVKIAKLVLGYEEGRRMVDRLGEREFGKQAATALLAEHAELEAQEQAAEEYQYKVAAYLQSIAQDMTEEELGQIQKIAAVHTAASNQLEFDIEKQAYAAGAEQASMAMDAEDGLIPGEDDMEAEPGPEEIAQVIMELAESGQIPPEVAEQLLAELVGAAGAEGAVPGSEEEALAAAAAAAAADGAGGGELPPEAIEAAAGGDEAKAAYIKTQVAELSKTASVVEELCTV